MWKSRHLPVTAAGEPAWKVVGPWESQPLTGVFQFSLIPTVREPEPLPHSPITSEWGKTEKQEDSREVMLFPRNQMFLGSLISPGTFIFNKVA